MPIPPKRLKRKIGAVKAAYKRAGKRVPKEQVTHTLKATKRRVLLGEEKDREHTLHSKKKIDVHDIEEEITHRPDPRRGKKKTRKFY